MTELDGFDDGICSFQHTTSRHVRGELNLYYFSLVNTVSDFLHFCCYYWFTFAKRLFKFLKTKILLAYGHDTMEKSVKCPLQIFRHLIGTFGFKQCIFADVYDSCIVLGH